MALSVSQNYYNLGIDKATLNQVSQEILKRAAEKNSQYKTADNYNFFQPRDLGIDLYNNKIDTATQKQIALNNSGLQIQLSQEAMNAIYTLNTKAAQNVQKNVEGKMTVAVNEITVQEQKNPTPKFNSLISLAANKDKNGSNPFYHGELLMNNSKKEEKQDDKQSIFA